MTFKNLFILKLETPGFLIENGDLIILNSIIENVSSQFAKLVSSNFVINSSYLTDISSDTFVYGIEESTVVLSDVTIENFNNLLFRLI